MQLSVHFVPTWALKTRKLKFIKKLQEQKFLEIQRRLQWLSFENPKNPKIRKFDDSLVGKH